MKVSKFSHFAIYSTSWCEKMVKYWCKCAMYGGRAAGSMQAMCKNEMDTIEPWSAIGDSGKNAQKSSGAILRLWQKQ